MKILVTGAEGMVGSALCPALRRHGHAVIPTDLHPSSETTLPLDIRELEATMGLLKAQRPSMVIHLAAETDVDRC